MSLYLGVFYSDFLTATDFETVRKYAQVSLHINLVHLHTQTERERGGGVGAQFMYHYFVALSLGCAGFGSVDVEQLSEEVHGGHYKWTQ